MDRQNARYPSKFRLVAKCMVIVAAVASCIGDNVIGNEVGQDVVAISD